MFKIQMLTCGLPSSAGEPIGENGEGGERRAEELRRRSRDPLSGSG